jgi:hypothetical protein
MIVSESEQRLRLKAAQSALASVRMAGVQPSVRVEALFNAWAKGNESLDSIRHALMAELRAEDDRTN